MTRPSPYARRGRTLAAALAVGFGVSAALTLSSPSAAEGPASASASPTTSPSPSVSRSTAPPTALPTTPSAAPPTAPSAARSASPGARLDLARNGHDRGEPNEEPSEGETGDPTDDPTTAPGMDVDLSPGSGPPGTEVRVTGIGVYCYDSGQERTNSARIDWVRGGTGWVYADSDEDGRIAVTLTVPDVAPGTNGVEVSCPNEGGETIEEFTVEAQPTPTTPTSTPPTTTPPTTTPPTTTPPTTTPPTVTPPTPKPPTTPAVATSTTPRTVVAARATLTPTPTPTPSPTPTPTRTASPPPAAAIPSGSPPSSSPAPAPERAGIPPISKSEFLLPMNRLPLGGPALALTAALAVLLIILIAFPADIFNKTYEACRREIHGLLRVRLLRKVLDAPAWFQGLLLVLTAAALWFLFSRHEGPATVKGSVGNGNLIAQTLALTVAIPLVMAVYTAPGEFYLRRVRTAVLRVPPVALAVAVLCGVVSYRLKLEPAYAFGLFAMFVPRHDAPKAKESTRARGVLFSSLTLGALVLVGYYGFTVNFAPAHSGAAGWTSVLLDAICYWVVVLGAECLIFTLLPMHFLDGRTLAGWSLWLWTFLQFGAACFFWQVLQGKAAADPTKITDPSVAKALLFFVIFGVLSLAFWKYFRWPNRPSKKHGDPDAPPLADLFRPAAAYRRYRDEAVLGWNWLNRVTRLGSGRIVRATRRAAGTLRTAAWHASTETRYAAALARYYLRATLRSVAERLRPPRPE